MIVKEAFSGGYILGGSPLPLTVEKTDARLLKTDSYGEEQWKKTFGDKNWSVDISVLSAVDDGYIIPINVNGQEIRLLKTGWTTIAAKPNNSNIIVAASHSIPGHPCVAYYSLDHGETWSAKIRLPLLDTDSVCSDPVVRWAPNSAKVYAAYMNINASDMDIVVSTSTNNGATWSAPVVALAGSATYNYDKPWLDVHIPIFS